MEKLSKKIHISRSVHQGCSISMLLFALSSVPILNMIEKNVNIKGFGTNYGNRIKCLAYADETTIVVENEKSIKDVL